MHDIEDYQAQPHPQPQDYPLAKQDYTHAALRTSFVPCESENRSYGSDARNTSRSLKRKSQMSDRADSQKKRLRLLEARFNSSLIETARLREQLEALKALRCALVKLEGKEDAKADRRRGESPIEDDWRSPSPLAERKPAAASSAMTQPRKDGFVVRLGAGARDTLSLFSDFVTKKYVSKRSQPSTTSHVGRLSRQPVVENELAGELKRVSVSPRTASKNGTISPRTVVESPTRDA
jgi:hypothetical protein